MKNLIIVFILITLIMCGCSSQLETMEQDIENNSNRISFQLKDYTKKTESLDVEIDTFEQEIDALKQENEKLTQEIFILNMQRLMSKDMLLNSGKVYTLDNMNTYLGRTILYRSGLGNIYVRIESIETTSQGIKFNMSFGNPQYINLNKMDVQFTFYEYIAYDSFSVIANGEPDYQESYNLEPNIPAGSWKDISLTLPITTLKDYKQLDLDVFIKNVQLHKSQEE